MDGRGPLYVESTVTLLVLVVTAVVLVVVALRAPVVRFEAADAVIVLVLAFVYLLLYTYLGNTTSTVRMWPLAVVIAVALTYGGALNLDGRDGRYLMLGLAIAASGVNSLRWSEAQWRVLAAVTATGLLPEGPREFGWTDGIPDDYRPPVVSLYSPLPIAVVTAVIVGVACIFATRRDDRERHDRV